MQILAIHAAAVPLVRHEAKGKFGEEGDAREFL